MIRNAEDLSPDQKTAIESLLGRCILPNESISIRVFESQATAGERRAEALEQFEAYFQQVDAQRAPVGADEAELIIDEALRSARPHYQSIR